MKLYGLCVSISTVFMLCFVCGSSFAVQESKSKQSLEYELALQLGTQAVIWGLLAGTVSE